MLERASRVTILTSVNKIEHIQHNIGRFVEECLRFLH